MHEKSAPNLLTDKIPSRAIYPSHEARALLGGISESTFRRQIKSGELAGIKIGAYVYVTDEEIERFLKSRPAAKAA